MGNLGNVIASMNIQFHDTAHELIALDSHHCLSKEVVGLTILLGIGASGGRLPYTVCCICVGCSC